PPPTTLFPYTTLFRSPRVLQVPALQEQPVVGPLEVVPVRRGPARRHAVGAQRQVQLTQRLLHGVGDLILGQLLAGQVGEVRTLRSEEHTSELQSPYDI